MGSGRKQILNNLYLGPKAREKEKQVRRAIARDTTIPGLYLITFASNEVDQLNIISARYLMRKNVRERLPVIAGAAIGYQEALETIGRLASEAYRKSGRADDLQGYLLSREGEKEEA